MTKPTSEQITFLASGAGATPRTTLSKLGDTVSVKDFGAVGDGVADDTAEINAALASGAKMVHFPAGTYKVSATLNVPVNVSIIGDGPNASIIDGSAATTIGTHILVAAGTWTALPALTTNPVAGDSSLVFASAPSVTRGDIICIFNPTTYSWSGFRSYYHAGEMQRVASVAGSTVTTQGSLYANYVAANVNQYKLTNPSTASISGIKLLGGSALGIRTFGTVDFLFDNVVVTGCSQSCILITNAWNCTVRECACEEDMQSVTGTDYGLCIASSMAVHVSGGTYSATRHAITTGGAGGIGGVPNRMIRYADLFASSSVNSTGTLDFHGNCEHCLITGCNIDGGVLFGGDYITVDGNSFVGKGFSDALIVGSECKGTNLAITDNLMQSYFVGNAVRGAFVDIGGGSAVISADTRNGGTIAICNNTMSWMSSSTSGNHNWCKIQNRGYTGTDISVLIDGNAINAAALNGNGAIVVNPSLPSYSEIVVANNVANNCGLIELSHSTSTLPSASNVSVFNNTVIGALAPSNGIRLRNVGDVASITNNVINGCSNFALSSIFTSGATAHVIVSGNTIIDGLNANTGSSSTNADIVVQGATNVACMNNVFGTADANRNYGMSFNTVSALLLRDNTAWQTSNTGTYINAVTAYLPGSVLAGSATYDPPNLVDGAGATTTVTVTGAALGDLVECVSFSLDLQGITVTGYVSAANTVSVRFQNESGGTLDLGSGTLLAQVRKA